MAKYCPISGFPIDIMTLGEGAYQVICAKSKWFSSVFVDMDDAIDFYSGLDIVKLLTKAKREERNGQYRLVGDGIMTRFMEPADLDALLVKAANALPEKPKRQRSSTPAPPSAPKKEAESAKAD